MVMKEYPTFPKALALEPHYGNRSLTADIQLTYSITPAHRATSCFVNLGHYYLSLLAPCGGWIFTTKILTIKTIHTM